MRMMGVELVEGRDLIIEDHHVHMKTASGLKKIDIILSGAANRRNKRMIKMYSKMRLKTSIEQFFEII